MYMNIDNGMLWDLLKEGAKKTHFYKNLKNWSNEKFCVIITAAKLFFYLSLFLSLSALYFSFIASGNIQEQKNSRTKIIRQYLKSWKHLSTCLNKYFLFDAKFFIVFLDPKRKTLLHWSIHRYRYRSEHRIIIISLLRLHFIKCQ